MVTINTLFLSDVIGAVEQFKRVRRVSTRYGDRDEAGFTFTNGRSAFVFPLRHVLVSLLKLF